MEVLIIISPSARISELKKIPMILNDLIKNKVKILFINIGVNNKKIEKYLLNAKYYDYECLIADIPYRNINEKFEQLKKYQITNIIVLGLVYHDNMTKYLNHYIGTNTNIFIVTSAYGTHSDGTTLINEGAYILSTICDLKKYWS